MRPFEDEPWPGEQPSGCAAVLVALAVVVLLAAAVFTLVGCGRDDRHVAAPVGPSWHLSSTVQRPDGLASPIEPAEMAFTDGYRLRPTPPPRANRATRHSTAAAPIRRVTGSCSGWAHLVGRYAWPVGTACAVLACESRGNPNARNRSSSATGLFQILNGPADPAANVAQAYAMWSARGWQPWNASRSCWG